MRPDLDRWLDEATLRITHRREADATPERLWAAAQTVRVRDTGRLGRLIRWRIPGTDRDMRFNDLFRCPPFIALDDRDPEALVSGVVGRIWTIRRDYPTLSSPDEFANWNANGTARVLFANWVEPAGASRAALVAEARVQAIGAQGRLGVAIVRPLVVAFQDLIGRDGIEAAVRAAEAAPPG